MNIKELIELNRKFTNYIKLFEQKLDNFEKQTKVKLSKLIKDLFPHLEIDYLLCLSGGNMCSDWNPKISITSVNKLIPVKTSQGIVWSPYHYTSYYEHLLVFHPAPITEIDLALLISSIEETTGLPCSVWIRECEQSNIKIKIRNSDDLLVVYLGACVIEQGEVYYKGWDIADVYFVYSLNNKIHIAYSVNGHGFGCDTYVNSGDEAALEKFYKHLAENSISLSLTKEDILNNWSNND